jgi:site-specific recombinase XerD
MESPEALYHYQQILAIPTKKKKQTIVKHLSSGGIKLLLEQPDKATTKGRRDLALLSLMYDSGARVQEIIDLIVRDFISGSNPTLTLLGKGNKVRRIPIMKNTAIILEKYIGENKLNFPQKSEYPLFINSQHNKLTKEGVAYILGKYVKLAGSSANVRLRLSFSTEE